MNVFLSSPVQRSQIAEMLCDGLAPSAAMEPVEITDGLGSVPVPPEPQERALHGKVLGGWSLHPRGGLARLFLQLPVVDLFPESQRPAEKAFRGDAAGRLAFR